MQFGKTPLSDCEGAILAHSLHLENLKLRKGHLLTRADLEKLQSAGVKELIVARLEEDEVAEDEAALAIANMLQMDGIEVREAGTGRVNFHATANGLFQVSRSIVDQINAIDPAITFATLGDLEPVLEGRMVATIKIIPYGVSASTLDSVRAAASNATAMAVHAYGPKNVGVISTILPGLKEKTVEKTVRVLEQRLTSSGSRIVAHLKTGHETDEVEAGIRKLKPDCDLVIVFGASAISDVNDVIPAGLVHAGGQVLRLGMPVDPGNLLMLGDLAGKPVIGAPGCARSPAQNGFDFVLNRIFAGIPVHSDDIAGMGVGGLLMEIGSRPQPRQVTSEQVPKIAAVILAAGQSRRMGDANKLVLPIRGKPMVRHCVEACEIEQVESRVVVVGHQADAVKSALAGSAVNFVENPGYEEGLSSSLAAGIGALDGDVTHALIVLGDMPEISADIIRRFADAVTESGGDKILMATHQGKRGNPVLWPRAYFEALGSISGDTGARHLIGQNVDKVVEIEIGEAASLDLDTPDAVAGYLQRQPD